MNDQHHRLVGESFSPLEGELLDLLCSGEDAASSIARAQRATARWGGYEHAGCECFLISTTSGDGTPPIDHDGGPFAMAEVADGTSALGFLELWVVDGYLHSVNFMPFGDDHVGLPTPDSCTITLIDSE